MKFQDKLNSARFLSFAEAGQLTSDLIAEAEFYGMPGHADRKDFVAYFLRNYCYLPFSAIAVLCEYSRSEKASRAVSDLRDHVGYSLSLCGEFNDMIACFKSVADEYYDLGGNTYLDVNCNSTLEEALLYMAAEECGFSDSRKNAPHYTPTPKDAPSLVLLMDILTEVETGACWSAFINDYEIKSTY